LVIRTFHRCFGRDFYIAGLFRLIGDTTQLIAPFFIKLIIDYMSNPNAPRWIGFSYVLMLMIISFLGTTLQSQYMHYLTSVSMRVRTALRSAIYSKLLRLSSEARYKMNTGDITNYMSIDAQKIGDLILFLHQTWSTVYQMIVCILFLIYFMGVSTLAGVSIMIIVIPVQSIIARLLQRIRR
jgi:ABC-type multidrug transport system fused ATPase/permease subunit